MKKVLIGFAVAAMAAVGTGASSVSAGSPTTDTIFDILLDEVIDNGDGELEDFLRGAGLDDKFDECGAPFYTVFFPGAMGVLDGVASAGLGYTDALTALDKAPALVNGLLGYHVVPGVYDYQGLADDLFTNLTNSVGGSLAIEGDGNWFEVNGLSVFDIYYGCNGVVYLLDPPGVLTPPAAPGAPSCGANAVGQCTPAGSGSGSGLPKTGSESMALTYAALASLIAGAGVLVIRRRSIA